jgi:cell division protein FtsQ
VKKILKISVWFLAIAGVITLMSFASKHQSEKVCWNLEIEIANSNEFNFVNKTMVLVAIHDATDQVIGRSMGDLSISETRRAVQALHAVKDVEVRKTIDGQMKIWVSQRTPISRILFPDGSSIYLDNEGHAMPTATHYTARVPVILGNIDYSAEQILADDPFLADSQQIKDCYELSVFTLNHPWLHAQAEHFFVDEREDFVMIPRVGNHQVVVGDAKNLNTKFKKLEAFYAETVGARDLNKYTIINLKYRDQVVCTKKPW